MPIKPENKHRYPDNWNEIRQAILEECGHKCELCGVSNYAVGHRNLDKVFVRVSGTIALDLAGLGISHPSLERLTYKEATSIKNGLNKNQWHGRSKYIVIVLTIMHLDHIPENCERENLKAACQRCHLIYDIEHHKKNAAETRKCKGTKEMFSNES